MQNMLAGGATKVIEVGPGNVLQGLFKKVSKELETSAA
jgi:[acyl-carrier-protein] S-malonyltransferase